jgi:hypothetical protein
MLSRSPPTLAHDRRSVVQCLERAEATGGREGVLAAFWSMTQAAVGTAGRASAPWGILDPVEGDCVVGGSPRHAEITDTVDARRAPMISVNTGF